MIDFTLLAMPMDLPQFTYHPNPLDTGSIVASEGVCEVWDSTGNLSTKAYLLRKRTGGGLSVVHR